jgi:hypothetical protein
MSAAHSYENYCLAIAVCDLGNNLVCDQSGPRGFAADQFRRSAFYHGVSDSAGCYPATKNISAENKT